MTVVEVSPIVKTDNEDKVSKFLQPDYVPAKKFEGYNPMTSSRITKLTKSGVHGRDMNNVEFAVYYGQIADIKKTAMGCYIQLDTGEQIRMIMCYNRLCTIIGEAKKAAQQS